MKHGDTYSGKQVKVSSFSSGDNSQEDWTVTELLNVVLFCYIDFTALYR